MILWTQTHQSPGNNYCWALSKLNVAIYMYVFFFNSEEITYKPPDISLMGRMLKMKFHVQDTGIYQYFTGKIVNYDGCSGKYGVYFPSDGEIVYMHPDDKDVVFLTWELSVHVTLVGLRTCTISYKHLLLWPYITRLSSWLIHAAFLLCTMIPPCWLYTNVLFVWRTKLNQIHIQLIDKLHSQCGDPWRM